MKELIIFSFGARNLFSCCINDLLKDPIKNSLTPNQINLLNFFNLFNSEGNDEEKLESALMILKNHFSEIPSNEQYPFAHVLLNSIRNDWSLTILEFYFNKFTEEEQAAIAKKWLSFKGQFLKDHEIKYLHCHHKINNFILQKFENVLLQHQLKSLVTNEYVAFLKH